jgi:hypothetical protein
MIGGVAGNAGCRAFFKLRIAGHRPVMERIYRARRLH